MLFCILQVLLSSFLAPDSIQLHGALLFAALWGRGLSQILTDSRFHV